MDQNKPARRILFYTMGSFVSAEVCELVGRLKILNDLAELFGTDNVVLYAVR